MSRLSRRQAIRTLASIGGASFLGGCPLFVRPVTAFCPNDPSITDPNGPLSIDIHTHVFNGSDLPIRAFFERILMTDKPWLKPLGAVLQEIAWSAAPNANQELTALFKISDALKVCTANTVREAFISDQNAAYTNGVAELQRALQAAHAKGALVQTPSVVSELDAEIQSLPSNYDDYVSLRDRVRPATALGYDFRGAIDFILRNLQYRYVNVFEYLREYSSNNPRKIDLMVAHLVDYDWPINGGENTLTVLADQVSVMEQISILTGGRVHCFAPFDPFREVAFRVGHSTGNFSSLALVQDAVRNHGCIGVKLYPPMGFAAFGNADGARFPASLWSRDWIPALYHRPDIGTQLDAVLQDLYAWCIAEHVPIMAHTAPTNVPDSTFRQFTDSTTWSAVPAGLRVDFGHFGETDEVADDITRPLAYARLMTTSDNSPGRHFFADSAYFAEILTQEPALKIKLDKLFALTKSGPGAFLADRLMYGTDWEMVVVEGQSTRDYLKDFEQLFSALDATAPPGSWPSYSDRFFGRNAAEFLDLRSTDVRSTRQRMEKFYADHGIPTPLWMTKVDRLGR